MEKPFETKIVRQEFNFTPVRAENNIVLKRVVFPKVCTAAEFESRYTIVGVQWREGAFSLVLRFHSGHRVIPFDAKLLT